jgi:hypothetical protein
MRWVRLSPGVFVTASVLSCIIMWRQGRTPSPTITALLQRPRAVDIWQSHKVSLDKTTLTSRTNPLVAQAQIYAKLLNPPTLTQPVAKDTPDRVPPRAPPDPKPLTPHIRGTPQKASPHFRVHATSVFAKHPEKSMALISEPGKGMIWIRPGDVLGHLKVTQIRKDAVEYAFETLVGEVAWDPSADSVPSGLKRTSSSMAMNVPSPTRVPVSWPPGPVPHLPNRLAAPQTLPERRVQPRPMRGGR